MAKPSSDPLGKVVTLSRQLQSAIPQLLVAAKDPEFASKAQATLEDMKTAATKKEEQSPAVRQLLGILRKNPTLEKPVLEMARTLKGTMAA